MDKNDLCGSPSRDAFKLNHKQKCSNTFYACDADLFLLVKPHGVVALLDYKTEEDRNNQLPFSEVLCYVSLSRLGIPVYIISGDADTGKFTIELFVDGDTGPPISKLKVIATTEDWTDYQKWEAGIRRIHGRGSDGRQQAEKADFD